MNFIKKNNLYQTSLTSIIGEKMVDVAETFTNCVLLKKNYDNHIVKHKPKNIIEEKYIDLGSVRVEIGKMMFIIFKFIVIFVMLYIIDLLCSRFNIFQ